MDELMKIEQAADFLGVSTKTMYSWTLKASPLTPPLPVMRAGRLLRFRKADLEKWMEQRTDECRK